MQRSRMLGAIPPLPHYAFIAELKKHKDNFTLPCPLTVSENAFHYSVLK
jgi:hypothetical protein